MTEQMSAIKSILGDALAELTTEEFVSLTMEPFKELREDGAVRACVAVRLPGHEACEAPSTAPPVAAAATYGSTNANATTTTAAASCTTGKTTNPTH